MYLVFDIGGTNTRIAISEDGKTISEPVIMPTSQDFEQAITDIKQEADKLGQNFEKIGCGIAGVLDSDKTMLIKSPHLLDWENKPLKNKIEEILNTEVKLENDVALGGLGEATFGDHKKKIIAYIAIGTGVGGVRIVNGSIDKSSQGFEPGHQIISPDGNQCSCGGKGHLETYISGAYLKDPINWDEVSKYLAIGLNNTIVHWSPTLIILGGSVSQNIPLDKVTKYLAEILIIFPSAPHIYNSTLGNKAGLLGALKLLTE